MCRDVGRHALFHRGKRHCRNYTEYNLHNGIAMINNLPSNSFGAHRRPAVFGNRLRNVSGKAVFVASLLFPDQSLKLFCEKRYFYKIDYLTFYPDKRKVYSRLYPENISIRVLKAFLNKKKKFFILTTYAQIPICASDDRWTRIIHFS